jgi:hypothetical protein
MWVLIFVISAVGWAGPGSSRQTIHQVVDRLWVRHGLSPLVTVIRAPHEDEVMGISPDGEMFQDPGNFQDSSKEETVVEQRNFGTVKQEAKYRPRAMDLARNLLMSDGNRCLSNIRLGDLLAEKFVESGRIVPSFSALQDHVVKARRALSEETGQDWSFASCSKRMK